MCVTWLVTSSPLLQVHLGAFRCYSKAWHSSLCCLREQSQSSFSPCVFLATSSNKFCCCFDCTLEWLTLLVLQKLLSALFDCLISMLVLLIWSHVKGGLQDEKSVVSFRRLGQPKGMTVSYALEQESQPSLAACISRNIQQGNLAEPSLRDTLPSPPQEGRQWKPGPSPLHVPYSIALYNPYSIF